MTEGAWGSTVEQVGILFGKCSRYSKQVVCKF